MNKYLDFLKKYLSILLKVMLTPEDQTLRYTTSDNKKIDLREDMFDAKIIFHQYRNQGVVYFDRPITEIKATSFMSNETLTSVVIPNSVVSIGERAFCVCEHLIKVVLPNNLRSIEYSTFGGDEELKEIVIPDSVTSVGDYAFQECKRITGITMGRNVISIGQKAFWCCTNLTDIQIPDKVTSIGKYAFNATAITEISIPDGVISLEEGAFRYCRKLRTLTIGKNVTSIDIGTFDDCESLAKIYCKAAIPPKAYCNRAYPGPFHIYNYGLEKEVPSIGLKLYVPRASVKSYETADFWKDYPFILSPYDFKK